MAALSKREWAGGGAVSCQNPVDLRLGDVVRLLEQGHALVEYLNTDVGDCTIEDFCRLRTRLRSAEARFFEALNRSSLAEITLPRRALKHH